MTITKAIADKSAIDSVDLIASHTHTHKEKAIKMERY